MANYKKITDVEVMEEVSENSMALVNENGVLKQVPCGKGFGGVATAIIKDDGDESFACSNMSFSEAWTILNSGEPLMIALMWYRNGCITWSFDTTATVYGEAQEEAIRFRSPYYGTTLYWTSGGVSFDEPSTGNSPA